MKSRSLGLAFIAAVIVPSILLAVLSLRAAGREEAYVERQLATTLDVETAHAVALANSEVQRIIDELRAGIDVPPGSAYGAALRRWKAADPLVDVPFLLSPRYGILWPTGGTGSGDADRKFLQEQGDFLSDRAATAVLQNIADRYQQEILAKTEKAKASPGPEASGGGAAPSAAGVSAAPAAAASPATSAAAESADAAPAATVPAAAAPAAPSESVSTAGESESAALNRQKALDAFAQSPAIQTEVYASAAEKGDTLSARVAQPQSRAASNAPVIAQTTTQTAVSGAEPTVGIAAAPASAAAPGAAGEPASGAAPAGTAAAEERQLAQRDSTPPRSPAVVTRQEQPSQYVVTSRLLSQIASAGDAGIIPRFVAGGLVFLFWERQADGRIAGCQIAGPLLRTRIAAVLQSTSTGSRILTFLDENGAPLAAPPDEAGRDWSRPFVSREIGPLLPRWEAAAYLTRPDAISAQARSSSLVLWILVVILVVSVAGGGSMVLTSVVGEMRLAQKKATFVTNVSHELKTPLTSIGLFIDLLRRPRPVSASKRESYLAQMASETERLTRLINNVLDFSAMTARGAGVRPARGTTPHQGKRYVMRVIDAASLVEEVLQGQRVRLENLGFTVAGPSGAGGCTVRVDPEALKQVLLNLLSNAEKYSRDRREIAAHVERAGSQVLIHVLDRGIGVPERERERIFKEFYRIDDSLASGIPGTGLGLTIALRIAQDHGGDIACLPREGGGSDFVIRLPALGEEKG